MKYYTIRIDEELMEYLRKHARPYEEREPNDTLRKLFNLNHQPTPQINISVSAKVSNRFPSALQQILEVYSLVRNGEKRTDATNWVAKERNITPQSVIDKYTRQLGQKAYEIDRLMEPANAEEFKNLLSEKFPFYRKDISEFLGSLNLKQEGIK